MPLPDNENPMPLADRGAIARMLGTYGPALFLQTTADICANRAALTQNATLAGRWARLANRIEQWTVDPAIGL